MLIEINSGRLNFTNVTMKIKYLGILPTYL